MISRSISENDKFVVLGSDGVFDFLSNEEVVKIALEHECPALAATAIVKVARARWIHGAGGYIDDITAVVVRVGATGRR